jgi:hypothetical protein
VAREGIDIGRFYRASRLRTQGAISPMLDGYRRSRRLSECREFGLRVFRQLEIGIGVFP